LHQLKAPRGANRRKTRVGRGQASGLGKTAGRGGKGQKARTGNMHFEGFEGGQMPLQRRLPKRGFNSPLRGDTAEVRLSDLNRVNADKIDILALKDAGIVPIHALTAKVIVAGELKKKVTLHGLLASKGARAAIEAAGGKIEMPATEKAKAAKPSKKEARREAGVIRAQKRAAVNAETIAAENAKAAVDAKAKADEKSNAKAEAKAKNEAKAEAKQAKTEKAAKKKAE